MRIVENNDYFPSLERASRELEVVECNLKTFRFITNYKGLAPGTEQAIKDGIPEMEKRIDVLNDILRVDYDR